MQSETPIYVQIRNQVIEGIASGKLSPGDTLPSVRQMASDLGINLHTVNKVYALLKQEGFLVVHRKSGVVVNEYKEFKVTDSFLEKMESDLKPIVAESICRGLTKEKFLEKCLNIYEEFRDNK
jgi:DNA-binding transcriptional regulator YhcF (GntR family)